MKILLVSDKTFYKEQALIRFNLKKHTGIFQTTDIGKTHKGINTAKIFIDKDILLLKESDAILICNFKKGKQENHIGEYSLMIATLAYFLQKKIYLLYDMPSNKYKEQLMMLEAISLNGNLNKI
jgi:hypothetical protein